MQKRVKIDHFSCYENNVKYYPWGTGSISREKLKKKKKIITKVFIKVISGSLKPAIEEN